MLYTIIKGDIKKFKITSKDVYDWEQVKDIKLKKGENIYKLIVKVDDSLYISNKK